MKSVLILLLYLTLTIKGQIDSQSDDSEYEGEYMLSPTDAWKENDFCGRGWHDVTSHNWDDNLYFEVEMIKKLQTVDQCEEPSTAGGEQEIIECFDRCNPFYETKMSGFDGSFQVNIAIQS